MVSYRLQIKFSAAKEIAAVPRARGAAKLAGYDDRYRLRVRALRIAYLIHDASRIVTVYKVGRRNEIPR